jgi:hypothetical protein
MPASDILNTSPTDPLNPDYGWQKKRPTTQAVLKASAGAAYFREITDIGHQFALNWGTTVDSQKSWTDIARLKRYFEQYRDGYFTLIDWEGNQRQYVGRFTTPVEPIPVGHNRWAAQNVIFEEVPGAEMLVYPGDWTNESIWRHTENDFGDIMPSVDDWTNWTLLDENSAGSQGPVDATIEGAFELTFNMAGSGTSAAQPGTGFFFGIPAGATILGIVASFSCETFSPNLVCTTASIQLLKAGSPVGTPKSSATDWNLGSPGTETFGTSTDLWGTTWSPSDINSPGFGFAVEVGYDDLSGGPAYSCEGGSYQITVYYTVPEPVIESNVTNAWAEMAYVGWGCQIWAPTSSSQGIADIYLDGVSMGTVDQYTSTSQPSTMLLQLQNVSLGTHVLQVVVSGTKNSSSSGYTVIFDSLKVMR